MKKWLILIPAVLLCACSSTGANRTHGGHRHHHKEVIVVHQNYGKYNRSAKKHDRHGGKVSGRRADKASLRLAYGKTNKAHEHKRSGGHEWRAPNSDAGKTRPAGVKGEGRSFGQSKICPGNNTVHTKNRR